MSNVDNTETRNATDLRHYLAVLSRFPVEEEMRTVEAYGRSGAVSQREAAVDLIWALMNSPEFLYRH